MRQDQGGKERSSASEHRPADETRLGPTVAATDRASLLLASQNPCLRARIDHGVGLWRIDRVVRREEVGVTLRGWHEHSLRNIRLRQLQSSTPRILHHPCCAEFKSPCAHRSPSTGARSRRSGCSAITRRKRLTESDRSRSPSNAARQAQSKLRCRCLRRWQPQSVRPHPPAALRSSHE